MKSAEIANDTNASEEMLSKVSSLIYALPDIYLWLWKALQNPKERSTLLKVIL